MTRVSAETVAILVIALAPFIGAGTAEAHGGDSGAEAFMAEVFTMEGFTVAVSVTENFATGASAATGFGLAGFSEDFIPVIMGAIIRVITDTALAT